MKETTMNTYKNFEKNANIILAITCVLCACFMWRVTGLAMVITSIGFATSGILMITHFAMEASRLKENL